MMMFIISKEYLWTNNTTRMEFQLYSDTHFLTTDYDKCERLGQILLEASRRGMFSLQEVLDSIIFTFLVISKGLKISQEEGDV